MKKTPQVDPDYLDRLRQIIGDNVSEFARRIGFSQVVVNNYVRGRQPSYVFLLRMAEMGYDLNWLLAGTRTESTGYVSDTIERYGSRSSAGDQLFKEIEEWIRRNQNPRREAIWRFVSRIADSLYGLPDQDVNEIFVVLNALVTEKRSHAIRGYQSKKAPAS